MRDGDAAVDPQQPEEIIDNVLVSLKGFTKAEIKDIIGYMRSVEAFRPSRLIFVQLEDSDKSLEEARILLAELWPEPEGPPFTAIFRKEKDE